MSFDSLKKFHQLSAQVPEYSGYDNFDTRKKSDQALRQFLIDTLTRMLDQLVWDFSAHDSNAQHRLDELVKSTRRKLKTINLSLKKPTYEELGFFAVEKCGKMRLQRIYDLEVQMMLEVDQIVEELAFLTAPNLTSAVFEEHFLRIQNYIDNVNQFLFEREALIVGEE